MPEPKRVRAEAALDDVSDHLGVMLQRADELLREWSAFGAGVRNQVEREAAVLGDAVAGAVDAAVTRAAAAGVDRALTEQLGARLAALAAEIARLEARTRAARAAVAEDATGNRRILWIVAGGVALANALLVAILLQRPPAPAPAPLEPAKVDVVAPGAAEPLETLPEEEPQIEAAPAPSWLEEIAAVFEGLSPVSPSPVSPTPSRGPVTAPHGTMGASAAPPAPLGAGAKLPPRRPHKR